MNYNHSLIQYLETNEIEIAKEWVASFLSIADILEQPSLFSQPKWVERLIDIIIQLLQSSDDLAADLVLAEFAAEQIQQQNSINEGLETLFLGKQIIINRFINDFGESNFESLKSSVAQIDRCINILAISFISRYQKIANQSSEKDIFSRLNNSLHPAPIAYPPLEVHSIVKEMTWTILRTLDAQQAFIYLKDKNDDFFNPFFALGDLTVINKQDFNSEVLEINDVNIIQKVIINHDFIYSTDPAQVSKFSSKVLAGIEIESLLILPISSKNHSLGIAFFCNLQTGTLLEEQLQLASTIAHAMGLAIENEILYEEKKKRLAETDSLRQITFALLQKLNLEEVLEIVCKEAMRLTNANGSAVYLLQDNEWLQPAFQTGDISHETDKWIALKESMLGLAVLRNKPVFINNKTLPEDSGTQTPISLLAVPLQINNESVGILEVVKKHYTFSKDDVRIIKLFAGQAGIAIENARLYQQAEQVAVLQERQRLARNLHDSLNQSIFGITMYAKAASRYIKNNQIEKASEYLDILTETAKESLGEMRLLVYELHPPHLQQKGLISAIEERLKTVEDRVGIRYEIISNLEGPIPITIEEELYWIAQEALNNVLKHANADFINISLNQVQNKIILEISDNGIGFDLHEKFASDGHYGLKSMKDRANIINADLFLETEPGKGSKVSVEVEL